jgi:hypothetical protein
MLRVRVRGTAAAAAVLAAAFLAGAATARAQCDPKNEQDAFRVTIDVEERIYQLEKIKRQIEVEHDIMTIYPGGAGLITSKQAGEMFGAAVFQGVLDPDSIPDRIRTMRVVTNIYLKDHIEPDLAAARACLGRIKRGPQAPPEPDPPSAAASQIDWPVPMDWIAVKGAVRGSYGVECSGYRDYKAFRSAGTWRLEFLGNGQVWGVFGDSLRQYSGPGSIKADGSASGLARSTNEEVPHLSWSAQFQRSGVDLLISSHKLDLMAAQRGPHSILVECKPGYMRQE